MEFVNINKKPLDNVKNIDKDKPPVLKKKTSNEESNKEKKITEKKENPEKSEKHLDDKKHQYKKNSETIIKDKNSDNKHESEIKKKKTPLIEEKRKTSTEREDNRLIKKSKQSENVTKKSILKPTVSSDKTKTPVSSDIKRKKEVAFEKSNKPEKKAKKETKETSDKISEQSRKEAEEYWYEKGKDYWYSEGKIDDFIIQPLREKFSFLERFKKYITHLIMDSIDPEWLSDNLNSNESLDIKEEFIIITDIDLSVGGLGRYVGKYLSADPSIFKEYPDDNNEEELNERKKQYKQCLKLVTQVVGNNFNNMKATQLEQSRECQIAKKRVRKGQLYMLKFHCSTDKGKKKDIDKTLYLRKDWAQWFEHWAIIAKFKDTVQKHSIKKMKELDKDNELDISQRIAKFLSHNESEHPKLLLNIFKNSHQYFTKFTHGKECEEFMNHFEDAWFIE